MMSETKVEIFQEEKNYKSKTWLATRYCQYVLTLFCVIIIYGHRTILSVGIIAMTEKAPPDLNIPTYPDWGHTDTILSSFFWGFIVTPIIAGQLGEYFGPKWFVVGTMIIGSVFNMLIPVMAASLGSLGVIICRVVQGLNHGFLFPSLFNLLSKWTPRTERSATSFIIYGGQCIGIAISMVVTGAIAGSKTGWPVAFYFLGACGVGWALVFAAFACPSPAKHNKISVEEKLYIESTTSVNHDATKQGPTPWKSIIASLPVWAVVVTVCGQCWGTFTLLTEIPSYMKNRMNFDINSDSELSSIPYVAQCALSLVVSPMADKIIRKKIWSVGTTRKIYNTVGTISPAVALFVLGFIDGSQVDLAVVLLVIAVGSMAFTHSGSMINLVDIAPNYAGTLVGIENCVTTVFSIMGPLSVEFLGTDKRDPVLWRKVFWLAAGIYVVCGLFFTFFSSGEVQPWNEIQQNNYSFTKGQHDANPNHINSISRNKNEKRSR